MGVYGVEAYWAAVLAEHQRATHGLVQKGTYFGLPLSLLLVVLFFPLRLVAFAAACLMRYADGDIPTGLC